MAAIPSLPKTHGHARSVSLPSRSDQLSEFDEQLCRLQGSEATISSSSIRHNINSLKDLYTSLDSFLLLPTNQRALVKECSNNLVNELLDELLRLLDLCSSAKDALLMTRNSTQELESVLRRKRGDCFGLMCAIQEYQTRRKQVIKAIQRASMDLKSSENKGSSFIKKNQETAEVIIILKEVESVTFKVIESFFSFFGWKSQSKPKGWFLVSKMMIPRREASNESSETSDIERVDAELYSLISLKGKKIGSLEFGVAQKELAELELGLQDLEEGLECVYRNLIKTRACLLNFLNC